MDGQISYYEEHISALMKEIKPHFIVGRDSDREFNILVNDLFNYRVMLRRRIDFLYKK